MTLSENIMRAIADFTAIKQAIINKGVDVPDGTPTSAYSNLIEQISGTGNKPIVDQDYVQDGLIAEWILDGGSDEILTNPLFVTDDTLGRTVGKVVNNADSFFVKKSSFDYTGNSGVTLQCLVNIDTSIAQTSSFFAIGVNTPSNTAFGIGMDNSGKLLVTMPNNNRTVDYTLSHDTWYHLAVVYESGSFSSYVNGEKVAMISKNLQISQLMSGAAIGTWVWSNNYPGPSTANIGNFKIANCCVYERPLSNSEIAANYAVDKKRYGIGG